MIQLKNSESERDHAMTNKNESCAFKTSIGGQALMEGILMRGPKKQAIVCRLADGTLKTKVDDLGMNRDRHPILRVPFLRGVPVFIDSLVKGMNALTYSASLLPEDQQEEPTKFDRWLEKTVGAEGWQSKLQLRSSPENMARKESSPATSIIGARRRTRRRAASAGRASRATTSTIPTRRARRTAPRAVMSAATQP